MRKFRVALNAAHGNSETVIEADDMRWDGQYLNFIQYVSPEPEMMYDIVASFAPGAWSHYVVEAE